ncbi:cysteine desulfurase NifS [soil metagenome]
MVLMNSEQIIYMDHAAGTPVDPAVFHAMRPYFSDKFYNPSAGYLAARAVAADIAESRSKAAHWLGSKPSEIIFTAGGTEANNLAIQGIMAAFPDANLIISSVEHDSVVRPAAYYEQCREVSVGRDGVINLKALEDAIDDNTVLISIIYANNEIGTLQPLKSIAALVTKFRHERKKAGNKLPIYFHTDACQAAAYLDLHVSSLGVDLMTLNGGKIYGPKQSGVLFVASHVNMQPLLRGGGQERNYRSGTENVAGIVGFSAALDLVQSRRHQEVKRLKALQELFYELIRRKMPAAKINGSIKRRTPNNVHITLPGHDNERLMMALDEQGILCAAGSACSASSSESSHVLRAIGLSDEEARSSLRFSMGKSTDEQAVQRTVRDISLILNS